MIDQGSSELNIIVGVKTFTLMTQFVLSIIHLLNKNKDFSLFSFI